MKKLFCATIIFLIIALSPLNAIAAQSATSTAETVQPATPTLGAWNGLEALQILNSPFFSTTLKNQIKSLDTEAAASIPIPVLFGVSRTNLKQNYGDERGTGRFHEGIDIVVPKGSPIVSPTEAVVISVGTGASSGITVSTANPGNETFVYMHLDSAAPLKAGDVLEPGDLIGYAGNTGNAAGGGSHLHFEIRKNGATNPYPRLTSQFSAAQKIAFVTAILAKSAQKETLAQFLAANYSAELGAAQTTGITLPEIVSAKLPATITLASSQPALNVLAFGARNANVVTLQEFLISQNKGTASRILAKTGATGYFGALTQAALIEYKTAAGINPPSGTCTISANGDVLASLTVKKVNATVAGASTLSVEGLKTKILELQAMILTLQIQLIKLQIAAAGA